jgi:hypothetical protein
MGKAESSLPCHIWTGANAGGYGILQINKVRWYIHRYTWVQSYGPIPSGLFVLHHCDTPACYEITHLFLGTQKDNIRDAMSKGRWLPPRKLTPEQVIEIRATVSPRRVGSHGDGTLGAAHRYGVDQHTIADILSRKIWKDV